ncbi:MAG: UDP-4-amino-4,6-dideoxy-N-acetyl-beta-L-altrosamine transaminase, partial [Candidatus Omnitrophica bacterium]|nr:UDP-4-amino-4,6-dideoxy-N-acetyl-beta-L-altrosamine transaminase [Candidatus Omnitrophota bacterium]
ITQGPKIAEFEKNFSGRVGAKHACALSSGTAGLHLAVRAMNLKPGDEVLVPAITFVATANAVFYAGATPKIVDIDPATGNISLEDLQKKITRRARGIIPVHFSGNPVSMDLINELARKHNLFVIEDAAHALGAAFKNKLIGSCAYSEAAVFSFHPVKHITTGEGGMVTTHNPELAGKISLLRAHGITREKTRLKAAGEGDWYYQQQELGFNYRLTDFQCALGISQLDRLESFVSKRRRLARRYRKAFSGWEEISCLEENSQGRSSYHLFVILLNLERLQVSRKAIFDALRLKGIGVQVHYIPLHFHPYYQQMLGVGKNDFPQAEFFYERALSLPLYPGLGLEEQDYVIKTLRKILTGCRKRRYISLQRH